MEKKEETKEEHIKEKIKKSLDYSVADGFFYSIMVGFGESFFNAFALFLNATSSQMGILGSLPQALGALSQLSVHRLMAWVNSRKKIVMVGVLISALMYLPITLAFFLGKLKITYLIILLCIYWIAASILGPAWNSWMGDLVNKEEKGAYFGKRNKIAAFATFFSFLLAGYVLQQFEGDTTKQYIGFAILFIIAFVARLASFISLSKKYEPGYKESEEAYFSFFAFLRHARNNNYGLFVIYNAFINFGVYVAAPFFVVYMLNDLKMSYLQYTLIQAASILMKIIAMPIWGKAIDRFGTKKVLGLAGFLMPLSPILWVFSGNFWYLLVAQLYSGLVWAAFDLSVFSFVFDVTTPQKRATCVAYFNVLNGFTTLAGALAGSFILTHLPDNALGSKFFIIFIISGVLRYMSSFIFIPKIREARKVEPIAYHALLFNVISTIPSTGGVVFSFINDIPKLPVKMIREISEITRDISVKIEDGRKHRRQHHRKAQK